MAGLGISHIEEDTAKMSTPYFSKKKSARIGADCIDDRLTSSKNPLIYKHLDRHDDGSNREHKRNEIGTEKYN